MCRRFSGRLTGLALAGLMAPALLLAQASFTGTILGTVTDTTRGGIRADAARLQTESASLGHVIDNPSIVSMPLSGRGAFSLVGLVPGVTDGSASAQGASSRIGGGRNRVNEIQLDGVAAVNIGNGNV